MIGHKGIKVLFVTHYRELYGANNSLMQMILELRDKGIIPKVLMPDYEIQPGNDLGQELDKLGIEHLSARIRFDKHPDWKKAVPSYILNLLRRRDSLDSILGMDFDIIHSNSSIISIGSYIAGKLGKPHIWHLREFGDLDYGMRTPFGKWFQKIIYGGNNTFIAISDSIRSHYSRWIGKQDIRVIYNGIKPSPKRQPEMHEIIEICIVGYIQREKGQLELIKAADILVNGRNIKNLHITLVGRSDYKYAEKINQYINERRLSDIVTMTGGRNDVPDLLTKMDIGVMASSHEAFGRTTVEYMMAGLAVIASDGGANKEIVTDGDTGLIYKSGDPESLADRIESLISNPEERERLAVNARKSAEKNFSSRANSDAVYNLYKEILNLQ
ncbi:MAG: glycosyltransferase family 4 protein [Muribaculaceae bacterium]|nr:glycosyltransferase family 4 protein [Muribaculaceae bacterium]